MGDRWYVGERIPLHNWKQHDYRMVFNRRTFVKIVLDISVMTIFFHAAVSVYRLGTIDIHCWLKIKFGHGKGD